MSTILKRLRESDAERGRNNRLIGEAFEFRILRKFKKRSDVLFSIRSAGSHSLVDIIIQFKSGKQYWINCKRNGYIDPKERSGLDKLLLSKPENVKVIMYYYISPKKMAYKEIK